MQLLDHEVSPTRQVPLLLEMMKYESALDKAITSGDPELGKYTYTINSHCDDTNLSTVNRVMWHIKQNLPLREFMMIFHKRPVAASLYKKVDNLCYKYICVSEYLTPQYCRENDHQSLLRLCEQESNNNEVGHIQFDHSFVEKV